MPCRTRAAGLEIEGWGNVFLEAAACGRPVIVGDSGGTREAVVHGETGLLVDGADVESRRRGRRRPGGPRVRRPPGQGRPDVGGAGSTRGASSRSASRGGSERRSATDRRLPVRAKPDGTLPSWTRFAVSQLRRARERGRGVVRAVLLLAPGRPTRTRLAAGPAVAPAGRATSSPAGAKAAATWPCPTCGEDNPIELDTCAVCGTSFAQLLRREEERARSSRHATRSCGRSRSRGRARQGRARPGRDRAGRCSSSRSASPS